MHQFTEIASRSTHFSLRMINEAFESALIELSETERTSTVKSLQALNLAKVIYAVGLFSIFEGHVQQVLQCSNGFTEVKAILDQAGETALKEEFHNYYLAINALKHGDGASYNKLVAKINDLDFEVDTPSTPAYEVGDLTAVSGLVKVDTAFIEKCMLLIEKVSDCIESQRPEYSGH
ncbi:hypothetical protein ACV8TO_06095 [Citrobacter freundii]|uniref:hypothetical protein n=1 Tax=Enterobacteriaceae TaxID=543 RepID=UPI0007A3D054|nr:MULTISPECIES: hypothetical protein [Enterobacteriaceae]EAX1415027.1 hypothetical protein [Salmonella enterica]ECE0587415.1 hypothetical protein [Salmonella enterica subsp. enterica]EGE5421003.1 hypothetical protein [Salmonella enterica subsp. enterica serovar Anatum]EHO3342829.1 hypothetical protein [Salmonella enterica subsp. enterica serovar Chester]EKP4338709.1 hypothetical protein [Salmonella enterica subsp. enterica serovar Senftenberg]WEP10259.1 hypothetical protein F9155_012755 [Sal